MQFEDEERLVDLRHHQQLEADTGSLWPGGHGATSRTTIGKNRGRSSAEEHIPLGTIAVETTVNWEGALA